MKFLSASAVAMASLLFASAAWADITDPNAAHAAALDADAAELSSSGTPSPASDVLDAGTRAAVEALIHEYMVNNIDDLVTMIQQNVRDAQEAEAERQMELQKEIVNDLRPELLDPSTAIVFGPEEARVSVVYFQDFYCPYCKSMSDPLEQALEIEGVQVINRYLPILGDKSNTAAAAVYAVNQVAPDVTKDVHDAFYEADLDYAGQLAVLESLLTEDELNEVASYLSEEGENYEFTYDVIASNMSLANSIGVKGTPFFVLLSDDNLSIISGAADSSDFVSAVQNLL